MMTLPSEPRDQEVANMLPVEIWHSILKTAIASPWLPHIFMPPPDNLKLIQGFRKASPLFEEIAADIQNESVKIYAPDNAGYNRDSHFCRPGYVRHLSLRVDDLELMDTINHTLEDFRLLQSFSVDTSLMFKLPCATKLVRLDFAPFERFMICPLIDLGVFKNLEELRIRVREHLPTRMPPQGRMAFLHHLLDINSFPLNEVTLANHILGMIKPLRRLRLISIHAALDPTLAYVPMERQHYASLEHLVPSEGYERHYSDCPICTEAYDHGAVIHAENTATRILAEGMPSLERVLWANAWMRRWSDENGQRGTNITREVDGTKPIISLSRDDEKDEKDA